MEKSRFLSLTLIAFSFSARADLFEALPDEPPSAAANPATPAKIELGRKLFFDVRLSKTGKVSCNSCHNVMKGGDDGRPVSLGLGGKKVQRSAPTVWNAAYMSAQFWDGRAITLEDQAKDHSVVVERLKKVPAYVKAFAGTITIDKVASAIAAYERTLKTPNSPFDKFIKGDEKALSTAAKRGYQTFETVGCAACHNGPNFAGPYYEGSAFYEIFPKFPGSPYETKYHLSEDPGRFEVTQKESDRHLWRVPTLRNVALTAPYFHNGSVKTLDEAVRVMAKMQLNKELKANEVSDLVAFLKSLTGVRPKQSVPKLP